MKKKLSTVLLALAAFMPMTAQNLVKEIMVISIVT